jgi:hypothetical protein
VCRVTAHVTAHYYKGVRTTTPHALLVGFVLAASTLTAQTNQPRKTFDCGIIGPSPSSGLQSYFDFKHGFHFEFPSDWKGDKLLLTKSGEAYNQILISSLFAAHDPKLYTSGHAQEIGAKAIGGHEWTALRWPDGRRGYYAYREGLAIEFVAETRTKAGWSPSPEVLTALDGILSSFTIDDASRLDRRIAALRPGDKLGSLTVRHVVPGTLKTVGPIKKIEFSGQLTLKGTVMIESTMRATSGYYIALLDKSNRSQIPLICPCVDSGDFTLNVYFSNQKFAGQQFVSDAVTATVVVDRITETFYYASEGASVTARLVTVLNQHESEY